MWPVYKNCVRLIVSEYLNYQKLDFAKFLDMIDNNESLP